MKQPGKNWLEWTVFGVGGVLVLATVGYLTYEAATSTNRPAKLKVRLGSAEPGDGEFAVPVEVTNTGDETAESVRIEVRLKRRDGSEQRAELEIQVLPGGATREGTAIFEGDADAAAELTARPIGFERP